MARLIVHPGTPQAWEITLKEGRTLIGRGEHNHFRIPDGSVSTSHCEIVVEGGAVRLKDLGSTNGTRIEESLVTETILQHGQKIHLGSVELLFEADAPQPEDQAQVVQLAPKAEGSVITLVAPSPQPQPAPAPIAAPPPVPRLHVSIPAPRLHISKPSAPPAGEIAPESPALEPPPVAPPMLPKSAQCKYHPRNPGRWWCIKCHKAYCDLCVTTRPQAEGKKFCKSCGDQCAPLEVKITVPKQRNFFEELPKAVIYPFRGTGVLVLIVSSILFSALNYLSAGLLGIFVRALALGYLFTYMQAIIHSTAAEDEDMPELPSMDGLLGSFFRLAGAVLVAFGLPITFAIINAVSFWNSLSGSALDWEPPVPFIAILCTLILGCLYFPMALLAVAMKDSAMAANPMLVIPAIFKAPLEYLVTTILLAGVFIIQRIGDLVASYMASRSMNTRSMSELFISFGVRMIWSFLSVYLLTFNMRVLGMLYLTKKRKLGWFNY